VATLARRLGLPDAKLRVLSARGNLLVQLAPAPVLARAATLTAWARRDPTAWLTRELAVAGHVAARGGPVAPPTRLADPGPHVVDGVPIALAEYRETLGGTPSGVDLGAALGAFHQAAAGMQDALPWLAPATEQAADALDACERADVLPAAVLAALRARHREVLAGLPARTADAVVLHGDAHAGNLLRDRSGWFWTDLEETCAGPPEWDLAVMSAAGAGPDALAAWATATSRPLPTLAQLAPFRAARELEATAWLLAVAHLHPGRYRALADARLAALLERSAP